MNVSTFFLIIKGSCSVQIPNPEIRNWKAKRLDYEKLMDWKKYDLDPKIERAKKARQEGHKSKPVQADMEQDDDSFMEQENEAPRLSPKEQIEKRAVIQLKKQGFNLAEDSCTVKIADSMSFAKEADCSSYSFNRELKVFEQDQKKLDGKQLMKLHHLLGLDDEDMQKAEADLNNPENTSRKADYDLDLTPSDYKNMLRLEEYESSTWFI